MINLNIRNKSVADSKPHVYSCSWSLPPQFWDDSFSVQVFNWCRVHQVDCGDLIHCSWGCTEKCPFLFFVRSVLEFSFVLAPPLHVGHPQVSVPCPAMRRLKQQLIRGCGSLRQGGGTGPVVIIGMRGKPAAAEASMMLQQPEVCHVFSRGSCPWITGPWQWRAAQAPGGGVWIVTCASAQDCWWQWQQP